MPGVLGIYTIADLDAPGFGSLKCPVNFPNRDGTPMKTPPRPCLARGKVRYVGESVAFVVAATQVQAKDAAEAVEVDIETLPADRIDRLDLAMGTQFDAMTGVVDDLPSFVALRDTNHDGRADLMRRVGTLGNTGIAMAMIAAVWRSVP